MIDSPGKLRSLTDISGTAEAQHGLHLFTDGSYAPDAGKGGWAFVAYRNAVEVASAFGGMGDIANNGMELMALLQAAIWVNANASGEPAVIWSDSVHAVKGCNGWRHIWKNNGWKRISANTRLRSRTIANAELWKAMDLQLSRNEFLTVAWCKGHSGVDGNERADRLADQGRLSQSGKHT